MGDRSSEKAAQPQPSLQRSLTQVPSQQPKSSRLQRISSYIGLGSVAKAQPPVTTEIVMQRSESMTSRTISYQEVPLDRSRGLWRTASTVDTSFELYRPSNETWESPNVVQTLETISCAMMANGIAEPIPRHLNGCIMSMIEEFRLHLNKLSTVQAGFEELRHTRQQEVKDFATMADEWQERECAFKTEIKRLEHIIADTQKGVESVILARAGSVVNRNGGRAFQARLNRLSRSVDDDASLGYGNGGNDYEHTPVEQIMRTSLVLPPIDQDKPPILVDHKSDVRLTDILVGKGVAKKPELHKGNDQGNGLGHHDVANKMEALRQHFGNIGKPKKPSPTRKSISSTASSSTRSSITQGISAERAAQDHVTPHTDPTEEPSQAQKPPKVTSADALATIQQMMNTNGGLPEDAVSDDDDGDFAPSLHAPHHSRAFSFENGDHKTAAPLSSVTVPPNVTADSQPCALRPTLSQLATLPELVVVNQFDGVMSRDGDYAQLHSQHLNESRRSSSTSSSSSSSSNSSKGSARSATLAAMGVNHANRQGSDSSGSSPSRRRAQSGEEVLVDGAIIAAARTERTIGNYRTKTRAPLLLSDLSPLPPQFYHTNQEQRRVRYTNGPQPGLSVRPIVQRGQVTRRRMPNPPGLPPSDHARVDDQDAITAANTVMNQLASRQTDEET